MTVRKSLAQQEEYRVRDRDGDREPQTEALPGGWELRSQERSDGTWWWDLLLRDPAGNVRWIATSRPAGEGNGYGRRIVAALNAEAALLARPVEPPDPDLEAIRQRRDILAATQRLGTFTADIVADYDALLARRAPGDRDREDAEKWRAAEADGHVVTFSVDGYGLQHPPSCRPDLIGCRFNQHLADADEPAMPPGRYRMTWPPAFAALAADSRPEE